MLKIVVLLCLIVSLHIIYFHYLVSADQTENFTEQTDLTVSNLNVTGKMNIFPSGIVVAWNGETPPTGWALCNGLNGTPNLTNKFVLGSGKKYELGKTGGSSEHVLALNEIPNHNHAVGFTSYYTAQALVTQDGLGKTYQNGYTNSLNAVPMEKTGGNGAHNNMHPYYVLAFIMKL